MKFLNKNNGVTIIALAVTVVVIMLLAAVSITQGTSMIKKAKAENALTNMITIRAKAKVYAEEVNAKTWGISDEGATKTRLYSENYSMIKNDTLTDEQISAIDTEVTSGGNYESYSLTEETLEKMGLDDIKEDTNYVVVYKADDYTKLDIVYKAGIVYDDVLYYTLSSLQEVCQ